MARAFAYSILAVLITVVISTVPLNIHEKMTEAERMAVFGSADSVPEYQVIPVSMSRAKHRREAAKVIALKVELHGKNIDLVFKRTKGYLATKYTPVWSAISDENAYNNIRYDPLPTAMSDIGEFKMYHDVKNEAAIAVYSDPEEEVVIEGQITQSFAIKSLPKRLMEETLEEGDNIVQVHALKKRSIPSDADKDTVYLTVFKRSPSPKSVMSSIAVDPDGPDNLLKEKRAARIGDRRKFPKVVYPEMLIVLDHNGVRKHTITQALRLTLAYWNGMDLTYRRLDTPKIYLNIAGIIIAADDKATPYIAKDTSVPNIDGLDTVLSNVGKYFYKERVRFPMQRYDAIIAMTTMNLCSDNINSCSSVYPGYVKGIPYCSSERKKIKQKTVNNTMILHYNWKYGPAHLYPMQHMDNEDNTDCDRKKHHIRKSEIDNGSFESSKCRRNPFFKLYSSKKAECYYNKPVSIIPVEPILPGRWLSMDGQCKNEGFAESCKLNRKKGKCVAKGCKTKNSKKCVPSEQVPLPGSKCGTDKYCNEKKKCVRKQ